MVRTLYGSSMRYRHRDVDRDRVALGGLDVERRADGLSSLCRSFASLVRSSELEVGREDVHALRARAHPVQARVIHLGEDALVASDDDLLHRELVRPDVDGAHRRTREHDHRERRGRGRGAVARCRRCAAGVPCLGDRSAMGMRREPTRRTVIPSAGPWSGAGRALERLGRGQRLVELVLDLGVVQVLDDGPERTAVPAAVQRTPARRG